MRSLEEPTSSTKETVLPLCDGNCCSESQSSKDSKKFWLCASNTTTYWSPDGDCSLHTSGMIISSPFQLDQFLPLTRYVIER